MEKRDRPELGKLLVEEIIEETLTNLGRLEEEVSAVRRRLLEHLEAARGVNL